MGEEGEEEEEGLEDIQEPSVMVTQVGRADSKQVSGKIILNHKIISFGKQMTAKATDRHPSVNFQYLQSNQN